MKIILKKLSAPQGMIFGILFALLVSVLAGMLYSLPQPAYCTTQTVTVRPVPADSTTADMDALGRVAELPAEKRVYLTIDSTPAFWVLVQFWDDYELKRGWIGLGSIDLCPDNLSTANVALLFSGVAFLLIGAATALTWRPV